jgi:hypothetical protein
MSSHRLVILKELAGERYLPIWIGAFEAEAIALRLRSLEFARPLTHDLLLTILQELGGTVERIIVNDLHDDTFYARVIIDVDGQELDIDSRPSDAIALAVRAEAPVYVEEHVMDEAGIVPELDISGGESEEDLSAFRDFVNSLDLDDLPLQ